MMARKHLKPELRKEPFVLAHLDCSSNLTLASQLTLHFRAESLKTTLLMTDSFVEGDVHRGPHGHEVIVVTNFRRRLGLWSLGDQTHSDYSHSVETVINSGHQSVAIELV